MAVTVETKREALERLALLELEEAERFALRAEAFVAAADLWTGQDDPTAPFLAMEVAVACQVAQVTATSRMRQARRLVVELPHTLNRLKSRELTVGQALVLLKETEGLSAAMAGKVEQLVLPRVLGMTPGDTRREVKRAVVEIDARASEERREEQKRQRRVWTSDRPDGRGFVGAEQSAEDAGAFFRALTELADVTFDSSDERTLDQRRADVFSHLSEFALGQATEPDPLRWHDFLQQRGVTGLRDDAPSSAVVRRRRRRRVQAVVLVPVETALDLSDRPGELAGYGPITGAHARELLAVAELRKACTDRYTGRIVALDATRTEPHSGAHRTSRSARGGPGADVSVDLELQLAELVLTPSLLKDQPEPHHDASQPLTDLVRYRDLRCVGPGCSCPSHLCDLEHWDPYPRGDTSPDNIGPASRRCHNAKTHGGWELLPHPDGSVTWTSPIGQVWHRPRLTVEADLRCLEQPRMVWPMQVVEVDIQHDTAA